MNVDRLEQSTQALRETTEREAARASSAALARVLDRLERAKTPSRWSMWHVRLVAWTLAASLLGVGAWANVTGRVSWFVPEPVSAPPAEPAAAAERVAPRTLSRQRAAAANADAPAPPEAPAAIEPAIQPPPALAPPESPRVAPPPRERARVPRAPAVAAAPAADADELYRAAHQAHFARADYAEALALWDRYLAEAEPGHRWKIEARYNRGIALYRLGRAELAREALEPFARGEYGGYRRADAQRLLEALPAPE